MRNITVRLYPNKEQIELFKKSVKLSNLTYNWGIDYIEENYKNTEKFITFASLVKEFKKLKDNNILELKKQCSAKVPTLTLRDLIQAYKNFFNGLKNHPKYKDSNSTISFPHRNDFISLQNNKIRFERIGWVRMKDNNRLPRGTQFKDGFKLYNCRILYDKSKQVWYSNIAINVDNKKNIELNDDIIGIDLGIKNYATLSNGLVYEGINKSEKVLKLKNELKEIRDKKFMKYEKNKYIKSKNILKIENKERKIVSKLKDIRVNYIHKLTREIVNLRPKKIVIEDFEVMPMLSRSNTKELFYEQNFNLFIKFLTYKCEEYNIELIKAKKYFASTQKCSKCGNIKKGKNKLGLDDRIYKCTKCGLEIDRDFNASINLKNYKN